MHAYSVAHPIKSTGSCLQIICLDFYFSSVSILALFCAYFLPLIDDEHLQLRVSPFMGNFTQSENPNFSVLCVGNLQLDSQSKTGGNNNSRPNQGPKNY